MNKNLDNSSERRNQRNNTLGNMNSKSPSFRLGNRTYINNDISFRNEGKKENELYRDSKELNKKYEQIQRRKKLSETKKNKKHTNKSVDIDNIKINNIQNVKIENDPREKRVNNSISRRNLKNMPKISSYEENPINNTENINNNNENIRKYNLNFRRKYYGNATYNNNNDNNNKDIDTKNKNIYNNITTTLYKNRGRFNLRN